MKISKTKIKKRIRKKTNPELKELISYLNKQKKAEFHKIAKYLSRPKSKQIAVNIQKINKETKPEEIIIVPGKVLSKGELDHKLTLAAFKFSEKAKEKLSKKADVLTIKELIDKVSKFKGLNIKIII